MSSGRRKYGLIEFNVSPSGLAIMLDLALRSVVQWIQVHSHRYTITHIHTHRQRDRYIDNFMIRSLLFLWLGCKEAKFAVDEKRRANQRYETTAVLRKKDYSVSYVYIVRFFLFPWLYRLKIWKKGLSVFNGISTFICYLLPKPSL